MSMNNPGVAISAWFGYFQRSATIFRIFRACSVLYICFWLARAFYRVYFHPLSRFPGPFVASFSKPWFVVPRYSVFCADNLRYEWYQNFHQKGQLIFEIERQHLKLGSFALKRVRITVLLIRSRPRCSIAPNELHINDPDIFLDMTKIGSQFTKESSFYDFITFPGTSIGETDPA